MFACRLLMDELSVVKCVSSLHFCTLTMADSKSAFSTFSIVWPGGTCSGACFSITASSNVSASSTIVDWFCKTKVAQSSSESFFAFLHRALMSSNSVLLRQSSSSFGMARSWMWSSMSIYRWCLCDVGIQRDFFPCIHSKCVTCRNLDADNW